MRSRDLTQQQAADVAEQLRPLVAYLRRLEVRMAKKGFPIDDEVYLATKKAYEAAHDLRMQLHYLSCTGVGKPSKRP